MTLHGPDGAEYDAEVETYLDGTYELMLHNVNRCGKVAEIEMPEIYYEDGAIVLDDRGVMLDDLYIDQNDEETAEEWAVGTLKAYDLDFDEDEVEDIVRGIYDEYRPGWRGASKTERVATAPRHADIMEWIDDLELSDFETTPTRGEDSYELHRGDVDLYITCINYGLWMPQLSWPSDPNIGLIKSDEYFDNPYDALEELVYMVYSAYAKYGSRHASKLAWRDWHVSPDETHASNKWTGSDLVDYYGYAEDTGYWEITMGGSGMVLVEGHANGLWSAIAECDAHARKSGYTAGRRLEYDDDVVVVRNPDGGVDYKGIFDYCPYKEDFDNGDWTFDGEKYEDRDHPGYTLEVVASKTAGDSCKVDIYGTDAYLVAEWNSVTLYRADGSSVRFDDAYADSEYKLTGKVMGELWWGGDDEEFDELQENVWNAVNDCFEWEREAYFMWEDEVYSSRRTAAHAGYDWRYDADGYYRLLSEFDDLREGQWIDIDGDWVTLVDTKLVVLSHDFDENSWSISAYDEGSNVDYPLFSEYPPTHFATPSDAIDWANDNINWVGEFRIPKLSSRKTASGIKYIMLEDDTIYAGGARLHRIQAVRSFGTVSEGDLGGYIRRESNLSHDGNAWVTDNAVVRGNAEVYGDAIVGGNAEVYGDAQVKSNAIVRGNAIVYGDAYICDRAEVCGDAHIYENAVVGGNAVVKGYAKVRGFAIVGNNAEIYDNAVIYGDANVDGNAKVYGNAKVGGHAWVFGYAEVYGDARVDGNTLVNGNDVTGSRKASTDWEPYEENVTPELRHDVLDPEEILDMYGAYTDESYRKVENGMLGVVTHHVGMVDDWWSWDTYAGYYSYGIDCGTCQSKDEAIAMCERSFADPGFTVHSSKTAKCYIVEYGWYSGDGIDYGDIGYGGSEYELRYTSVAVDAESEEDAIKAVDEYAGKRHGDDYLGVTNQPVREYGSYEEYASQFPNSNSERISLTASEESGWEYFEDGYCSRPLWTYYIGKAGRYSDVNLMVVQWSENDYEWSVECSAKTLDSGRSDSLESAKRWAVSNYEYRFPRGPKIASVKKSGIDKTATRKFTYAEMKELEDEIEGRELHNYDRFKDGGLSVAEVS